MLNGFLVGGRTRKPFLCLIISRLRTQTITVIITPIIDQGNRTQNLIHFRADQRRTWKRFRKLFEAGSQCDSTGRSVCYLQTLLSVTYRRSCLLPADAPVCYLQTPLSVTYRRSCLLPTDAPVCYLQTDRASVRPFLCCRIFTFFYRTNIPGFLFANELPVGLK